VVWPSWQNLNLGFPIGGVPPFGHSTQLRVFVDPDLLQYDEVWAAAGTWNDVFAIEPGALQRATNGVVSETHEVFDLVDAVNKTGQDDTEDEDGLMYNYRSDAALLPDWWEYTKAQMNPVSQFDTKSKLNKAVNKQVALDSGNTWIDYFPKGFGVNSVELLYFKSYSQIIKSEVPPPANE